MRNPSQRYYYLVVLALLAFFGLTVPSGQIVASTRDTRSNWPWLTAFRTALNHKVGVPPSHHHNTQDNNKVTLTKAVKTEREPSLPGILDAKPADKSQPIEPALALLAPAQSGGNFNLPQSVVAGGGGTSTGGNLTLSGSAGQSGAGLSTGGNFSLTGGFWGGGGCQFPISILPTTLAEGRQGEPYNVLLTATGGIGPYTFNLNVGEALPTGLTLAQGGLLSGTPTVTGTFNFTVIANDSNNLGCTGMRPYTLIIRPLCLTIQVNPAVLPNVTVGVIYAQTVGASGGTTPYSFEISAGALPNGLTLAANGTITGIPTAVGTFTFTIRATDAIGCQATRQYTVIVNNTICNVQVNPPVLPNGTLGVSYTQTIAASGGNAPYSFEVSAGTLPTGLTLAINGTLTGTPSAAGTFSFTIRATDTMGCQGTRQYTVTVTVTVSGLQFYPLPAPVRLLDTRPGASPNACSQPNAPIAGGTSRLQAARSFCGIPATAQALTGNVTTVSSGGGYLTLYPSGAAQPTVASTNYGINEIINNVFTVGLGTGDGAFNLFALNTTDVVVDVTGYYAPPAANGLYFHPLPSPVRLLETRAGQPVGCVKPGAPLAGGTDSLQTATTACTGIPAEARSVVGNATTVSPAGAGYLTLYPADVAGAPLVASSNYNANQIVNGPFTVGLSVNGQFKIFTTQTTQLVVDVLGYYSPAAVDGNGTGLLFTPLGRPVRLLETRAGQPVGCFKPNAPLNGGQIYTQTARGVCDSLTIPAAALAVVGNATVVFPASGGFLTLWPSGALQPTVATSNYNAGDIINRHFIVGLGNADGAFKLFSSATTELVLDLSGYFAP